MDTSRDIVQVVDVNKKYSGRNRPTSQALSGVSLKVVAGEFVAIVGRSGSGKSTLLHLIAGIDTPTTGSIIVDERDLSRLDEAARARLRRRTIGLIFQSFNLLGNLSARQNVMLPGLLAGISRSVVQKRAEQLLDQFGLASLMNRLPSEMSGGQQQRVAIARALINDPLLLLADEPTGNLDSQTGDGVLQVFEQCHATGQTIILVTHDSAVAARASRLITLADGQVAGNTPTQSVSTPVTRLPVSDGDRR